MPTAHAPLTPYHAPYYAYEPTRRSASASVAKIGSSLFNATVGLNPHQLDEVGLSTSHLWGLTRHELAGHATFDAPNHAFDLAPLGPGWPEGIPAGRYRFASLHEPAEGQHSYCLGHPLAQAVVERAKARPLRVARVRFDSSHRARACGTAEFVSRSGWLRLSRLTGQSLQDEDRLLFAALDEHGKPIQHDAAAKLFELGGDAVRLEQPSDEVAR